MVLAARGRSREALERLIRAYWKPAYFAARRWGADVEAAKDLTQGFFAEFLERDFLKGVGPEKGRFRTFLLTALKHYLANQAEAARAKKRGGGRAPLPLDFAGAESEYSAGPKESVDHAFKRRWALAVLERGLAALAREFPPAEFEALRGHLSPGEAPSYEETAERLGTTVARFKQLLHRARRRFRELIRQEVRDSVRTASEVDDEIRDLFAAL